MPRRKLLVVDDIEINRIILTDLFSDKFDVIEAENGEVALELISEYKDDLAIVLLDIVMPVKDGFDVLRQMEADGLIGHIPVILITGENDDQKALMGYALGVADLIKKPFNPEIVLRRVNNVIDLYSHQQHLEDKLLEQKIMLEKQSDRMRQNNLFLIDALSTTVEFRNLESGEHIKRIRILTKIFLEELKERYQLTSEEIDVISSAAALHDIGKIAIPDSVLLKPGPLTNEEFDTMKTHTIKGCEILETFNHLQDQDYYKYCYEICRHHHERWDGRGYPDGLKGDEISIWAQVTSIADVYDALTSKRVYKKAYSHDEATKMILNGECGIFNPTLLDIFVRIKDTLADRMQCYMKEEENRFAN